MRKFPWPLTSMQTSMVFETLHGSLPGNYIQQYVCRPEAPVSARAIQNALAIITQRHPALRLQFEFDGEQVSQTIADRVTVPVETRKCESEAAWQSFLFEDRVRGFDLRTAPLLRVTVLEETPEGHCVVVTNHHALLDGRSHRIVMRELFELLRNGGSGHDSRASASASFSTYLEWLASQDFSRSKQFWSGYLEHLPESAELPLPRPPVETGPCRARFQTATVAEDGTASLRALAEHCGCSLNNVVQAAWAIVLARYTGSDESVFGVARACRHSAVDGNATETVGLLINSVPIRIRMPEGATVGTVLGELKRLQTQLRDHENTPLTEMVEAAGRRSGEAMYSSYLMFEDLGAGVSSEIPGWSCELIDQMGLLSISATASRIIQITLESNPALYSESASGRILNDFVNTMAEMAAAPDREIDAIQAFALSVLSETRSANPKYSNVVEAVAARAQIAPESPAVLSDQGVLTYAELERNSNRLAHHLIGMGIRPDSRVGLSMDRSADLIVAFLGIWKAGCTYVPIDPGYPEERRRHMLEDSGAATVLLHMPECGASPEGPPQVEINPQSAAYLIYTSGSTGKPKGVLISHASLTNFCSGIGNKYELTPADKVVQLSTISFDFSVEEIFPALWAGATIVPASRATASSTADFTDFVTKWNCTVLAVPTGFWHELVAGLVATGRTLLPSMRLVAVGGERVLPDVYAAWKRLPEGCRIRWMNTYGPTEATVSATVFEPEQNATFEKLPIGTPLDGVSAYVLDARLRPVPLEASGELFIGGRGVALGYLNAADLTGAKFLRDPFHPDGRMYRTGDTARLLGNGALEFLGRKDLQVKFRGYRIELTEVEGAAESHPDVHQAIAHISAAHISNGQALVLFVVPREGARLQVEDLRVWLSGKLAEWMVPTTIVPLQKFPVTAIGKIDRVALAAVPIDTPGLARSAPETDLEWDLIQIWESVLQRSPIGVEDNFFSIGGYSLVAMRMLFQVERLTGQKLRFADISRSPTIRQFARALAGEPDQRLPECLVVLQPTGAKPPLFFLHGAGGAIHWYNDLASRMVDRPVIGVQSPESSTNALPDSFDEMCESYLQAIRHIQPQGPYHFIGHSMGGTLAYHCAVLCARRGDAVAFVGTLDGWNLTADNPTRAAKLGRLFRYFWTLDPNGKIEFARQKLRWLISEGAQRKAQAVSAATATVRHVIKANNVRLARRYIAPQYPGTVHVFRAREGSATEGADMALGWREVALTVVAVEVPGTHYSLLSPPNVDALAELLTSALSSCG